MRRGGGGGVNEGRIFCGVPFLLPRLAIGGSDL